MTAASLSSTLRPPHLHTQCPPSRTCKRRSNSFCVVNCKTKSNSALSCSRRPARTQRRRSAGPSKTRRGSFSSKVNSSRAALRILASANCTRQISALHRRPYSPHSFSSWSRRSFSKGRRGVLSVFRSGERREGKRSQCTRRENFNQGRETRHLQFRRKAMEGILDPVIVVRVVGKLSKVGGCMVPWPNA